MIYWWWVPILIVIGGMVGVVITACYFLDHQPGDSRKKWWEDE